MKSKIRLFTFFILLFNFSTALAEGPDFDTLFREGVKQYQAKKYDAAKESFKKALEINPRSVSTLTNLGLTHQQLGEKGWAIALLRKAAYLNPDFSTSTVALDFITPQLEVKEIPHEIRFIDSLHASILLRYPTWIYSLAACLFLFLFVWQLLKFLGARRRALLDETARPTLSATMIFNGALSLVLLTGFLVKIYDQKLVRATIVAQKVNVLSLPDEKAPSLFEIHQGLEVIVNQSQNNWTQITYPGGMTGWVPQNSIFITNGGT